MTQGTTEKKAVKPEKSQRAKRPWQPASVLTVPARFMNPRFVYRWVTESKEGNVRKKKLEGWEHDRDVKKKMEKEGYLQEQTILDGKSPDGFLRMRQQVLMIMPVEMAEERRRYYEKQSTAASEDAQERYEAEVEGRSYGKIKNK